MDFYEFEEFLTAGGDGDYSEGKGRVPEKGCFLSGVAQITPLIMEVMMTEMARMIIVICPRPQFLRLYGNLLICKSCASLLSIGRGIRTGGH